MRDELDLDALDSDLSTAPDFDLSGLLPKADDAPKEAAAEPEPEKTVSQELTAAFDEAETGQDGARAERDWLREQRRLADEALKAHGIDPAARHQKGMSRREATRRLYRAETALRTDPINALPQVARDYASNLDADSRRMLATKVIETLGFAPDSLDQAARQRLQAYEAQARSHADGIAAAVERLRPQLAEFKASRPDFDRLHPTMLALVQAGEASTLEQAYETARRIKGLPSTAEAADQARRSKVAAAKNAGTPRTTSAHTRAVESDVPIKSTKEMLEAAWDETVGAGR